MTNRTTCEIVQSTIWLYSCKNSPRCKMLPKISTFIKSSFYAVTLQRRSCFPFAERLGGVGTLVRHKGLYHCVFQLCASGLKRGSGNRKVTLNQHGQCRKSVPLLLHSGVSGMTPKWINCELCGQCQLSVRTVLVYAQGQGKKPVQGKTICI